MPVRIEATGEAQAGSFSRWLRKPAAGTTISPGVAPKSLPVVRSELTRQGRFRYLRTVIVPAAFRFAWGLGSRLRIAQALPLNLPAPGMRHPLYVIFRFSESCVFAKQSLGLFTAACSRRRPLYPEVTGANLPSSLTTPSPVGLRILIPSTCVGLRYGHLSIH